MCSIEHKIAKKHVLSDNVFNGTHEVFNGTHK